MVSFCRPVLQDSCPAHELSMRVACKLWMFAYRRYKLGSRTTGAESFQYATPLQWVCDVDPTRVRACAPPRGRGKDHRTIFNEAPPHSAGTRSWAQRCNGLQSSSSWRLGGRWDCGGLTSIGTRRIWTSTTRWCFLPWRPRHARFVADFRLLFATMAVACRPSLRRTRAASSRC